MTGYLNAVLQQLFMIPEFRWTIMSFVPPPPPTIDKKESLIWQLQKVFSYLQESQLKYYNPKGLCHTIKDYDGEPMDVNAMQDVNEFMEVFLDKLVKCGQEQLVHQFFSIEFANQLIPKNDSLCAHLSERDEKVFTLSLEIKNHKSIPDALASFVQGEMIEGDWGFTCNQCQREVAVLKRCCLKTLPDNLVLHLKRYEFDLDTLSLKKITDVCEFPMVLDMEPYSKEALAMKDNISWPNMVQREKSYYMFKLVGFIVHTGKSAKYGRNYSIIQERVPKAGSISLDWYKFDDKVVELFDPEQIPQVGNQGAYMLFYQRIQLELPIRNLSEDEAAQLVPEAIHKAIKAENEALRSTADI